MRIGCHLSSSGGYLAMAQTAESIGANVFQFFTRNPRGGAAKPIDKNDIAAFLEYAQSKDIGPILAHAPYTLNAASADERTRQFAELVFIDDLRRLEFMPQAMYNFHPGSHVGQGVEKGIELIANLLARVIKTVSHGGDSEIEFSSIILLETMAGKGSEVGRNFAEIRAIINRTAELLDVSLESTISFLGVCLDTCHVWDAGYDIVNELDKVIEEFDAVIGLERLRAVHLNDSMNVFAAHKDRHEKIGKGNIGLDAFRRIVNHPLLRDLPFYLETPCDLQGYKEEIELVKGLK